jgi:tetratricopeptide (TPR) repeat protein
MPLANIGSAYLHMDRYDRAEKYFFESLDTARNQEVISHHLESFNNFAELYHKRGLDELSMELLEFLAHYPDADAELKHRVAGLQAQIEPSLTAVKIAYIRERVKHLDLDGIYLKIKASLKES